MEIIYDILIYTTTFRWVPALRGILSAKSSFFQARGFVSQRFAEFSQRFAEKPDSKKNTAGLFLRQGKSFESNTCDDCSTVTFFGTHMDLRFTKKKQR